MKWTVTLHKDFEPVLWFAGLLVLSALANDAFIRWLPSPDAADNIVRSHRGRTLQPYGYQELGYVVSLGDCDAVGWLAKPHAVLKGIAAAGLKTAIEGQYDLLLKGVDTYFDIGALQAALGKPGAA